MDYKKKTVGLTLVATRTYTQEFTYDDFVNYRKEENPAHKGLTEEERKLTKEEYEEKRRVAQEEFDAKMLPLWRAFVKKHKKGIELPDADDGEDDEVDILDLYTEACDEMEELVNA